ncbi:MAG: hypothetical protein ACYC2Y_10075 [Armatimonadota bacterium]
MECPRCGAENKGRSACSRCFAQLPEEAAPKPEDVSKYIVPGLAEPEESPAE